ncbi:hypothetical protein CDCA_CDCA16G4281 [Cyanidium caldarium]|uniref:Uncharacterized protein n=1 Tax=Cyanidium caldarium TaxID=2771 RepID=A0AAV9J1U8_CYACA|nr:hypothetical protein CDCA_CDCA16G4281 [Cyanidium caldarium]
MAERKAINKYLGEEGLGAERRPRRWGTSGEAAVPVRFVLPFTVQCERCGTMLHRGSKRNAQKERVKDAERRRRRGAHPLPSTISHWRCRLKCSGCHTSFALRSASSRGPYRVDIAYADEDPERRTRVRIVDAEDGQRSGTKDGLPDTGGADQNAAPLDPVSTLEAEAATLLERVQGRSDALQTYAAYFTTRPAPLGTRATRVTFDAEQLARRRYPTASALALLADAYREL